VCYQNPVLDEDKPDPDVLYDPATRSYWMTHTAGGVPGWPLWKSADLVHWTPGPSLLDARNKPDWIQDRLWAPEIHRVGSRYVLVSTARDTTGRLCIAVAAAPAITGPYTVRPEPLVRDPTGVGVIDPHLFEDSDGKNYLLWKDDGNDPQVNQPCHLFIREMDADGTSFASGSSRETLLTSNTAGWENNIIEAPWMLKHGSTYYLFYSGNHYYDGYAEGVARSDRPTGGFTRFSGNPVLRTNDAWRSPGHGAFVKDAEGTDWHLFHAYRQGSREDRRVQLLDRIDWECEPGWPHFGNNGSPTSAVHPGPAARD
jgi:beta-xylosidase